MYGYGELYRQRPQISSRDLRIGRRTEAHHLDAQKRHRARAAGARLPLLRPARRGQDHLRAHLRQGDQLPASRRGRGVQRLRVVPLVQRESFAQHPRTGRRVEQLGGRHPQPDRTGAHPAAGRPLLGLHHRRGAHALGRGVQRLSQNARRAARTRRLHSGHHRETQDPPHDPLALPDLRFQPHQGRGLGRVPQIYRRAGGRRLRRGVAEPHRAESRRRYARRTVDVRQGRVVLRRATRIQVRRADAQRAGLRHLFQRHRHAARRRLPLGAAAVRRGARQGILRPDLHGRSGAAHARPARGARRRFGVAHRTDGHPAGAIPRPGRALYNRISFRGDLAADRSRRTNPAIVEPTAAGRTGTDENSRSRSKKK